MGEGEGESVGALKLVNHKDQDWTSIQLQTLSVLTLLFTLRNVKLFSNENKQKKS